MKKLRTEILDWMPVVVAVVAILTLSEEAPADSSTLTSSQPLAIEVEENYLCLESMVLYPSSPTEQSEVHLWQGC